MLILIVLRDIGSSLMFYGGLLAILYVATGRISFVVVGLFAFALGAWYLGTHIPHVHDRVEDWLHPVRSPPLQRSAGSYQMANALFAQAAGGLFGQGFGQAALDDPRRRTAAARAADRHDLRGHHRRARACSAPAAVLLDLPAVRGPRASRPQLLARDSFSTLLAVGLSAMFALQVFVIVGGVTRVIPLTGVTLPFISYGGSSIVANFVLRRAAAAGLRSRPEASVNAPIARLFGVVVVLFALLLVFTSRWTVFDASSLNNNPLNVRTLIDELQIKRGRILADDGDGAGEYRCPAPDDTLDAHLPDRPAVRPAGRLLDRGQGRGGRARATPADAELRGVQTGLSSIFGQLSRAPSRRRRLHDARPQGPAVADAGAGRAAPARWSRSIRGPARSRSCTPTRATTTTTRRRNRARRPSRRFNRVTQGSATRRARRSRS